MKIIKCNSKTHKQLKKLFPQKRVWSEIETVVMKESDFNQAFVTRWKPYEFFRVGKYYQLHSQEFGLNLLFKGVRCRHSRVKCLSETCNRVALKDLTGNRKNICQPAFSDNYTEVSEAEALTSVL